MEDISYSDLMDMRSSSTVVKDFSRATGYPATMRPPVEYNLLMDMARTDPVIFTAIDLTVDMITYNGYSFDGSKEQVEKAKKVFENELDFDQEIKNILWQLLIYGDAYLELVGKNVTEIHAMETTETALDYDKNGNISAYYQMIRGVTDKERWVKFNPDDVVYFRLYNIGTRVYSHTPLEPAIKSYNSKIYANYFLQSLFTNMHPRMVYFLKNANKDQRALFIENLIKAKSNPGVDIVGLGEATANLLSYDFSDGLLKVLEYLRTDVLMVTRVPKHWIGITEGANRGMGENVVIPFETRVKKIQGIVASYINKKLMERVGFKDLTFRFNPISLLEEKSIFQNAQVLHSLQIETKGDHPVITYLKSKGIQIPEDAKITNPTELAKDSFPSRQRGNLKTDKMSSGLDRKGVSEAGGEKLQEKQVEAAA